MVPRDRVLQRWLRLAAWLVLAALVLGACAAGENPAPAALAEPVELAGFWRGAWHGVIAPITFVISLFSDNVNLYEVHNNGNWYDFGFVLGAGIFLGGGGAGARRR